MEIINTEIHRVGLCPKSCRGCAYHAGGMNTCDYILIEGHPRGCPIGKGCTKRIAGRRRRETVSLSRAHPPALVVEKRIYASRRKMELYSKGMSDGEIARELKLSASAVRQWRVANSLPAHVSAETLRIRQMGLERIKLYNAGMSDREIAEVVGCSPDNIATWRGKQGLPPNPGKAANRHVPPEQEALRMRLYEQGLSDSQAAKRCGLTTMGFARWRQRHKLPGNGSRKG